MPDDGHALGRIYDTFAAAYAEDSADNSHNAHYDRPSVLALCGDVAGLDVLDACCGPGHYAEALLAAGARLAAFDGSAPLVEITRQRVGPGVDVRHLDLGEPLPYADSAFDLVVCALAIHYIDDRLAALTELRRVLRSSGALVLSTQHPTADWLRKGGGYFDVVVETDVWWRDGEAVEVSYWREPLTALCDAAHQAGFLIERLVEPLPAESMRERWPQDYEKLRREPGFINLRLVPRR
jgi:SAM-dependent methyltransferase